MIRLIYFDWSGMKEAMKDRCPDLFTTSILGQHGWMKQMSAGVATLKESLLSHGHKDLEKGFRGWIRNGIEVLHVCAVIRFAILDREGTLCRTAPRISSSSSSQSCTHR